MTEIIFNVVMFGFGGVCGFLTGLGTRHHWKR